MWDSNIEFEMTKPQMLIKSWAAEHKVLVIDLLPSFRKIANATGTRFYYHSDPHWNIEGHHLAGGLIYEWLREEQLIP